MIFSSQTYYVIILEKDLWFQLQSLEKITYKPVLRIQESRIK